MSHWWSGKNKENEKLPQLSGIGDKTLVQFISNVDSETVRQEVVQETA